MASLRLLTAALAVAALWPAVAGAAFFPGDPVDGPSVDVEALGDLDLARDGTGALAYVKREGGVEQVFVARFVAGAFQPAERLGPGADPVVAAAGSGRLAVVYASAGTVLGTVRSAADQPWSPSVALGAGADPAVDMSINGTAYASFTSGTDVLVSRLDRRTNAWATLAQPADVEPARAAGTGARRSRVAVSADGVGLVVWGEDGADGRTHVWARKAFGVNLSSRPQDLTSPAPAGSADSPDVDVEDDSSFGWVTFRQAVGGGTQILARRQRGTEFDPPAVVDAGDESAELPRVDLNGRGEGLAAMSAVTSRQPMVAVLRNDVFGRGARIGAPGVVAPAIASAFAENNDGLVAWAQAAAGELPGVRVRPYEDYQPGPEVGLSRPELGAVDPARGLDAATDRAGSVVVAWVQGEGAARRIVAGLFDRPPRAFAGYTTQRYGRRSRPGLRWAGAFDLWGPLTYRVEVDGVAVGQTTGTGLVPTTPIADGVHTWRVVAVDRRGQATASRRRLLRIDATDPGLAVRLAGVRRAGRTVRLFVRAADVQNPRASGIERVRIAWGDGTTSLARQRDAVAHRYPRGRFRLRASATDGAGNTTVVTRSLRIAKRKRK